MIWQMATLLSRYDQSQRHEITVACIPFCLALWQAMGGCQVWQALGAVQSHLTT